jgi:hypothetical protein
MADWVPIYPIDKTTTKTIYLFTLSSSLFPSTSPRSSSVLHGRWIDDDEALERLGRLEQPIAAARPNGIPPGRVGFRVSRDLVGVSCVSRSRRGSSGNCLAYRAHRWRHKVQVWTPPRRRPIPKSARPYIERSSPLSSVWPNLASTLGQSQLGLPYYILV